MSVRRVLSDTLRAVVPAACMALLVIAVSACGATSVPRQEAEKTQLPRNEAPPIVYSSDLGASLYYRIEDIARQESGPFTVQTTDQQATSALLYAADQFPENPIRRAAIWFTDGQLHIYAQVADLTPMILNFRATGRVQLTDGWPILSLDQASVGAFQLPGYMRSWLARVITETIHDTGIPHRFHSVTITEGRITITGEVLP